MKNKNLQLNNKGAAMMVAILAVALFAIIGGMILSTTIAMSTRANRVSAYADEKCLLEMAAMEIIKTHQWNSTTNKETGTITINGNKENTNTENTLKYTFDSSSKTLTLELTSKNLQLIIEFTITTEANNVSKTTIQSWKIEKIEKKTADGNT